MQTINQRGLFVLSVKKLIAFINGFHSPKYRAIFLILIHRSHKMVNDICHTHIYLYGFQWKMVIVLYSMRIIQILKRCTVAHECALQSWQISFSAAMFARCFNDETEQLYCCKTGMCEFFIIVSHSTIHSSIVNMPIAHSIHSMCGA